VAGLTFAEALGFGALSIGSGFIAGLLVGYVLVFIRRLRDVA